MDFLAEYGLFFAKVATVLVAILFVIAAGTAAASKNKKAHDREMVVEKLNDTLKETKKELQDTVIDEEHLKELKKADKKKAKESAKKDKNPQYVHPKRVYVLSFDGDIKASAVDGFREAVTAVLQLVDPEKDEIVVKLESPGGMVHSYGLASAQLDRIKSRNIKLTACVDKVAASGGYMMACVADKIVASPFAIMGSIGVVAQLPNFNRLLKKNDIDFEILTAGEYKRTLTMFGENTKKGREKFQSDLEDTHELFKAYVSEHRPSVDIDQVANGDIWFGIRAKQVNLVDQLMTSDDYLLEACKDADVFTVDFKQKETVAQKLGLAVSAGIERATTKILSDLNVTKGMG